MSAEPAANSPRHLRAVPAPEAAPDLPRRQARPSEYQQRAAEFRRESLLLDEVRGIAPIPRALAPEVAFSPPASAPVGSVDRARTPAADLASVGHRFEALAAPSPSSGSQAVPAERLSEALERLRAATSVEEVRSAPAPRVPAPERDIEPALAEQSRESPVGLWLAPAIRLLASTDPEAAVRWFPALLTQLHRAGPTARIDLSLPGSSVIAGPGAAGSTDVRVTAQGGRWERRRGALRVSPKRLAGAVFAGEGWLLPRRQQVRSLAATVSLPTSLGQLCEAGAAVDPLAFWRLVAAAMPACSDDGEWLIQHRAPVATGGRVTIRLAPGRPLTVDDGSLTRHDAVLTTAPEAVIPWALGIALPVGSVAAEDGAEDAFRALRSQIAGLERASATVRRLNDPDG